MYITIRNNLHRQFKALELLSELLEEEFNLLLNRDAEAINTLEFSIHELLRQIASERVEIKNHMQGTRLLEYANLLQEEESSEIKKYYHLIDSLEQHCSKAAAYNTEISLSLMDQNQALLDFLQNQITPRSQIVYGAHGQYKENRPSASMFSGRF